MPRRRLYTKMEQFFKPQTIEVHVLNEDHQELWHYFDEGTGNITLNERGKINTFTEEDMIEKFCKHIADAEREGDLQAINTLRGSKKYILGGQKRGKTYGIEIVGGLEIFLPRCWRKYMIRINRTKTNQNQRKNNKRKQN